MRTLDRYRPLAWLVLVAGAALLLSRGDPTRLDILLVIATTGLIAISLGLVYGQAGVLSVAQAAFASVGAYATAILTQRYDLPIWFGLLAAVAIPAALAYAMARVIVRLSALALAVATLLLSEVLVFAFAAGGEFTGGFIGISGIPGWSFMSTRLGAAVTGWAMVLVATVIVIHVLSSQQGRALRVIATDEVLARSLGIDVTARLSRIFALGGALAGSAGWLYAHTRTFLSPEAFPVSLSLTVLMMVIIGGKRVALGPIAGATALTVVLEVIPGAEVRGMFYGVALVLALVLFPDGLLGTAWRLPRRGAARVAPVPPVAGRERRDEVPATEVPATEVPATEVPATEARGTASQA